MRMRATWKREMIEKDRKETDSEGDDRDLVDGISESG